MLKHCPPTLTGKRDRALLALGFAGAFRRSELVALQVADLVEMPDGLRVLAAPDDRNCPTRLRHNEALTGGVEPFTLGTIEYYIRELCIRYGAPNEDRAGSAESSNTPLLGANSVPKHHDTP